MKKFLTFICIILVLVLSLGLFACGDASNGDDGTSVDGGNNTTTDGGNNTPVDGGSNTGGGNVVVPLKDIIGVSLTANEEIDFDGSYHYPTVVGTIPNGVVKKWYFNDEYSTTGVRDRGNYEVKLELSGTGYNKLTLTSDFTVKLNAGALASKVIDSFGETPDPWTFLPQELEMENKRVQQSNIPTYVDFTSVSNIPDNYIGKQLNVVYGVLNKTTTALGYVNKVYGALNVIKTAYVTFLNTNPQNYSVFEGTATIAGVQTGYKVEITSNEYNIYAYFSGVNVRMYANTADNTFGGRIELPANNVLKYTVTNGNIKIALNILNSASTQIEFIRDNDNPNLVQGYIYEYLSVSGHEIKAASAYLNVGEDYTTVVGTKGDFILSAEGRNCEVYENSTGKLIGTEVSETMEVPILGVRTYDTMWFNLSDISGITSIKKEDASNGVNPDTIYLNGKADSMHSMFVNVLSNQSRRFDIEFKTVCAYVYNTQKQEYELEEFEVPMVFVQELQLATFEEDFESKNDIAVTVQTSSTEQNAIKNGYHQMVAAYNAIKNNVTQAQIIAYCEIA